jgi:dolichol-phosphate mannosyltransferase
MIDQLQARSTLSVVAPCYDEAAVIRELHRRVTTVCRSLLGDSYELVLVNDGSRDKIWEILQMLAHCDDRVVAVDLSRNH